MDCSASNKLIGGYVPVMVRMIVGETFLKSGQRSLNIVSEES